MLLMAVDVGTSSARAGLFDGAGALLASDSVGFEVLRPAEHHAVYRMDDIWNAVCAATRSVAAAVAGEPIAALAFDATSSLALTAEGGAPLDGDADVLCWMDHRGESEAEEISRTGDLYLDYVGGSLSPEMHLPKLLWLKRHRPAAWARLRAVRDLCDELAYRATGADRHSACGLACKFPYLPAQPTPWRRALLQRLDLLELLSLGALGAAPPRVGETHGRVSVESAPQLGLAPEVTVAVGLIDAEAGALGVLGRGFRESMNRVATLIGGTSTCYMTWAADERRIRGVWGPFKDAVFPGYWMHESGQSHSGAALDAVLRHHPGGPGHASVTAHAETCAAILDLMNKHGPAFGASRHIVPDWLGNRAPLGDGRVRALVHGVGEETTRAAFLEHYYATARALALQSRQILEHLNAHGYAIDRCALSGGHLKNPLLVRLYRDALNMEVTTSEAAEPVLLGTAMVAATAAGLRADLFDALDAMSSAPMVTAADPRWRGAHDAAYRTYLRLFEIRNDIAEDSRRASRADEAGSMGGA
jgi:FGGY-family pentulose kinase